jgi:ArsR family transcriptional regulator, arsenate/arsenite/antimonite-responsive transcriptional repressor
MSDERLDRLENELRELRERVADLEAARSQVGSENVPSLGFGLTDMLRTRKGEMYESPTAAGVVTYAGVVGFEYGEYIWEMERPVPALVALESETLAPVLAALGSPLRLVLVKALLQAPRTNQQLQEIAGIGSPGQLYHHLKELIASGVIEQHSRNLYRVSPAKLVPILTIFAAVLDIGG